MNDHVDHTKIIEPVAHIRTQFASKFGVPRQSGLAPDARATIVFDEPYRNADALRGIEGFSHLWLIWGFHKANTKDGEFSAMVRPPRLGGNEKMGVFATRSPFRPNGLGLSVVALLGIEATEDLGTVLHVGGADLVDGTPVYDVKPYIAYADSIADAKSGFANEAPQRLDVECSSELLEQMGKDAQGLLEVLACDPRPAFHNDPQRIYGFEFAGFEVKFSVDGATVHVEGIEPAASA